MAGLTPTSFFKIDVGLLNGPCLISGSPIPLHIQITKLPNLNHDILFNDFQTMLVETTEVRAQGTTQKFVKPWIVDSTARINHFIRFEETSVDLVSSMRDHSCFNKRLPAELTTSFEICNIKRTYRLDVRLGFLLGNSKVSTHNATDRNRADCLRYSDNDSRI
jgi:hypothetical protein